MNKPKVFAVKHADLNTRMKSRSGGIFTAISDVVLNNNGVVYGCVLTNDLEVIHTRATTKDERNAMRGSKYVQSDLSSIFKSVKSDLDDNLQVLFSGTSCQISGLLVYLGKEYKNLLCLDIVCHGVPSPKVFKDYINWQENKNKAKCTNVDFRNKVDFGWKNHVETLNFKKTNGEELTINKEIFTDLFYGHNIIRPSCFMCPYKDISRVSDISIGDFWGIDTAIENFNDNKGVSLVLVNTEKGMNIFEECKKDIEYRECKIENSMQEPLLKPFPPPPKRGEFWKEYSQKPFQFIVNKYGKPWKYNIFVKILRKIKKGI